MVQYSIRQAGLKYTSGRRTFFHTYLKLGSAYYTIISNPELEDDPGFTVSFVSYFLWLFSGSMQGEVPQCNPTVGLISWRAYTQYKKCQSTSPVHDCDCKGRSLRGISALQHVGFSAGDGIHFTIPGSLSDDIIDITDTMQQSLLCGSSKSHCNTGFNS